MQSAKRIQPDQMATQTCDGRDELNLAEFPLCALAHRPRRDQKTLRFEDQIRDGVNGGMVTRQLTVTGSDAYGLPTALDDEVLLALVQSTRLHGFADRKVPFTRYQLIALLGWRNETKSYERIEASLNRWTGVTLYYRNAWWDNTRRCWVDETFHVLDNVWLRHRRNRGADGRLPSTFVWNEVIFRSFQAGNLKRLDFEFFRRLDSAVAKRLYRFLDKRFFHRRRLDFGLQELAWEHVGLARSYDTASLKRKLRPGIVELEELGFLEPMADADRFTRVGTGEWRVAFTKAAAKRAATVSADASSRADTLVAALVQRGVSLTAARRTVQKYPAQRITAQLEVFDWLVVRADPKVTRNPPGFLVSAIKEGYDPPRDFVSRAEEAKRTEEAARRRQQAALRRQEEAALRERKEREQAQVIGEFWASLSETERLRLETEALAQATPSHRKLLARGGRIGDAARQAILDARALALLKESVRPVPPARV